MRPKQYVIKIVLIAGVVLFLAESLYALDIEFRPRLETGILSYAIEFGADNTTVLSGLGETTGHNTTHTTYDFDDTMRFAGGGTTLFFNRMFVDLCGQYAFNGRDQTTSTFSEYSEESDGHGLFITGEPLNRAKFNRADYAVSVGYALTRRLSVFGGYKWADVDLKNTFDGPISKQIIDSGVAYGRNFGHKKIDFKYEGWFIGLTHGWQVGSAAQNMLSINLGLAYLNSRFTEDANGTIRFESLKGQVIDDPIIMTYGSESTTKGDTLGVALGINWLGTTMIEKLSYSVSISGYRYKFESERSNFADISENTISFKLGLSYAF